MFLWPTFSKSSLYFSVVVRPVMYFVVVYFNQDSQVMICHILKMTCGGWHYCSLLGTSEDVEGGEDVNVLITE